MSANINLVDKRSPDDSRREKATKIKGISFAVLFLTAFLALVIFVVNYRFSASYVKKQEAELLSQLSSYNDTSAKIFIVNSKLTDISNVLSQRKKYNTLSTQIVAQNTGGASIDAYQIDEAGITMSVSSSTLSPIDQFLNALLDLSKKKIITSVTLKSLSLESGRYVVELSII